MEKFGDGSRRFLLGFSKKVILANHLSEVSTSVFDMFSQSGTVNPMLLWIGSISYSLQIFYDFSGYSDMAIGLGKIFGFEFEENFRYPYISRTVTEFWRRWHISLGQWFRDYVYFPLGGSRVSISRHILNLFIVWTLTGIWHGGNLTFVTWGLGYFLILVIEKYVIQPEERRAFIQWIWQVATLLSINFGWVIFNSNGVKNGIRYCLAMMGYYGVKPVIDSGILYYMREYGFYIGTGIIFATPVAEFLNHRVDRNEKARGVRAILSPICYGMIFLWAVSFLILGAHNPFIYFNF